MSKDTKKAMKTMGLRVDAEVYQQLRVIGLQKRPTESLQTMLGAKVEKLMRAMLAEEMRKARRRNREEVVNV